MIDAMTFSPDSRSSLNVMGINAELNAAMMENQAWLAQLERDDPGVNYVRPFDTSATPRMGFDGPGFFVLDDKGMRVFARTASFHVSSDGRLLAEHNREVLGYSTGAPNALENDAAPPGRSGLIALKIPVRDIGSYNHYEVDDEGTVWAVLSPANSQHKKVINRRVRLGRLGVAIFPNPDAVAPAGRDAVAATPLSGRPNYLPAGVPHVGTLHRNPQTPSQEMVRANLRSLWSLSGRAEIEIALAASKDALARTALNLVR